MIPHALCHGRDIPLCTHCVRHVDRYTPQQQASNPGRIAPTTTGTRCDAWRHAPAVRDNNSQPCPPAV